MKARSRPTQDWQTEAIYKLLAKVYRQAIAEAWRGSKAAQTWLDIVEPDWRQMLKNAEMLKNVEGENLIKPEIFYSYTVDNSENLIKPEIIVKQ